jgi:pimeloyl-ACP methyl ester carboxylesterase/DNA-binding CsgD family transcriptional regulator
MWLTHLQYDLESIVWRHWVRFFGQHYRFVRYDERGCGMTQWKLPAVSLERWREDLEAVVGAAFPAPDSRFMLLGVSQGAATAIAYAVRHPERVSHLILYGGFSAGIKHRDDAQALRLFEAIVELVRYGWGGDDPAFRQVFITRFVPDATPEQLGWLNDLCRRTTTAEIAAHLLSARANLDVRPLLGQVRVPTLVLHASQDQIVPIDSGRALAAGIPGAEFVQLDSRNHILLEHEPAWLRFKEAVLEFTGRRAGAGAGDARFAALSPRERDILLSLAAGRSNAEIAGTLRLSEKTVRNVLTGIFGKLGVRSRAQAIVLARDHGYTAA